MQCSLHDIISHDDELPFISKKSKILYFYDLLYIDDPKQFKNNLTNKNSSTLLKSRIEKMQKQLYKNNKVSLKTLF
jgi:hypothetical protein